MRIDALFSSCFIGIKSGIEQYIVFNYVYFGIFHKYLSACFQDRYQMTINYELGQTVSFYEKTDRETEDVYDLFPPVMFCMAASEQSRQYICSRRAAIRRGITADHPFAEWLLENSIQLNRYFQRQFQQITQCLCEEGAEYIIKECNRIREQLLALADHHGVDVVSMPQLGNGDFWEEKEDAAGEIL